MKRGTKLATILLLLLTLKNINTGVSEQIRYNQGLKAKKDSLFSLDITAGIGFEDAIESELNFVSNWGEIKKETIQKNITLPGDYKGAQILLTDTDNGFLNIVAFNRETKKCLVTMVYGVEEYQSIVESQKDLIFTGLTLSECLRVRISRYGESGRGRLISYITESGIFNWIARPNPTDENVEWKATSPNLFDGYLNINEYHQVQTVTCYNENRDFFYIYQKSGGHNSQDLFKKAPFFYSNSRIGTTSSSSYLTLKVGKVDYFTLAKLSGYDYELENVNLKSKTEKSDDSGFFLIFKKKNTGEYKTITGFIESYNNFRDENQYYAKISEDGKQFTGTADFRGNNGNFTYYYALTPGGDMKLCTPKDYSYSTKGYLSNWEYNCLTKSNPGNLIKDDEFVDHVTVLFYGKLAIVTLRNKGNPREIRNTVYDFSGKEEIDFDFTNKIYIANKLNIYEIPRIMSKTEEPQITLKKKSRIYNNYFLLTESTEQPPNPHYSVSDSEKNVTHNIKLNFMDKFVEEYIEFNEFYVRVKQSQKGSIITDSDYIKIRAEYIKSYDLDSPDQFFYVTPLYIQQDSEALPKIREDYEEMRLSQVPIDPIPSEENYPLICETSYFYFFSNKKKPEEIAFYSPKNRWFRKKIRYMMLKIKPTPLRAKEYKIFSSETNSLFIGRGRENNNIYSVMSINMEGDYYIREFYSETDLMSIKTISYHKYTNNYAITFNNGMSGLLEFEKLYPCFRVNGDIQQGKVTLEGVGRELTVYVTYDEAVGGEREGKAEVVERTRKRKRRTIVE